MITDETVVGQPVFFTNTSHNSDRFEWDFGDGYTSNESDPVHTFTSTGSYEVIMTAFAKGGHSDETRLTLNIVIPTLLEIEVREYYSEDLIPGASIILYPTVADWDAQTNMVDEGFTDADGVAVFSNLDPFVYYVDVWEATHDNYQLRNEDVGFITTPQIVPNKINRFIAWVDVASSYVKEQPAEAVSLLSKNLKEKPQIKDSLQLMQEQKTGRKYITEG